MIWFRNYTIQDSDSTISQIKATLGLEGYARYYILIGTIVEQMDGKDDVPSLVLARRTWEQKLHCKGKTLDTFLDQLQNIVKMKVTRFPNAVEIELPWLQKLLDKNAVSSAARRASGVPRIDKIREDLDQKRTDLEKTIEDQRETRSEADHSIAEPLSSVTAKQRDPVNTEPERDQELLKMNVISSINNYISSVGPREAKEHFAEQYRQHPELIRANLDEIWTLIRKDVGNDYKAFERYKSEYQQIVEDQAAY